MNNINKSNISAADAAENKTASVTGRAGAAAPEHDAEARPRGAKLIKAPYISQKGTYPTGCESVSTVMLLQYLGYKLTVDDFIRECLDIKEFEERGGALYGPDPRKYFCGDPYSEDGMGCYAPVIVKALERAFAEFPRSDAEAAETSRAHFTAATGAGADKPDNVTKAFKAFDETGRPLNELLAEYVDNDIPVIFWACINMREPIRGPEWLLTDDDGPVRKFTSEKFTWISNEHCMLLVGYDEKGCWFNDPYDGNGVAHWPWDTVRARHAAQHSMAVGVKRS